jgi:hypothetical protein
VKRGGAAPRQAGEPQPPGSAAIAALAAVGRGLLLLLQRGAGVLLALVLLFEEWGWRPLADLLARLGRFALWARLEAAIAALPPYAALGAFLLPTVLLLPLKVLALYLVAQGHLAGATALLAGAKVAGTALVARIFALTQPRLMEIGWFARLYGTLVPWRDAAFARIRATWAWRWGRLVKARARAALARARASIEPRARALWRRLVLAAGGRPGGSRRRSG